MAGLSPTEAALVVGMAVARLVRATSAEWFLIVVEEAATPEPEEDALPPNVIPICRAGAARLWPS
jgi:hypothetical protein